MSINHLHLAGIGYGPTCLTFNSPSTPRCPNQSLAYFLPLTEHSCDVIFIIQSEFSIKWETGAQPIKNHLHASLGLWMNHFDVECQFQASTRLKHFDRAKCFLQLIANRQPLSIEQQVINLESINDVILQSQKKSMVP